MIETLRLLLRELQQEDLDDLVRLYADRRVIEFIGNGCPAERSETEAWLGKTLAHRQEHGFGTWSIRLKTTGEFVGRAGLTVRDLEHGREVELGYVLAAEHWHKGYATEAAAAIRDHAIQVLGFPRLIALIDPENEASKRVAAKLGMIYERNVRFGSRWRELGRMVDLYALQTELHG